MGIRTIIAVLLLCGVAWLAGLGYVTRHRQVTRLAQENHLTAEETEALRACIDDLAGKSLKRSSAVGSVTHLRVPDEICVCQAREMVKVFKPGEYGEHRRVADFATTHLGDQMVSESSLKPSFRTGVSAFAQLSQSLDSCAQQFSRAEQLRTIQALTRMGRR